MGVEENIRSVPSIEDSMVLDPCFPSVSERYFTHYYYVPKKQMIRGSGTSPVVQHESTMATDCELPCKKPKLDATATSNCTGLSVVQDNTDSSLPSVVTGTTEYSTGTDISKRLESDVSISSSSAAESVDIGDGSEAGPEYHLTGQETLVMVHSNKLCVISLSPHHPIVRYAKTVTKVEYDVFGVDRLNNTVSGKGKRGAQVMGSKGTLCRLLTEDGGAYNITCGARGKLVQVNEALIQSPDLSRTACGGDGWLGVIMPRLQDYNQLIDALMPAHHYTQAWSKQCQS